MPWDTAKKVARASVLTAWALLTASCLQADNAALPDKAEPTLVDLQNLLCQANLREIGQALHQYAAAHQGQLPDACDQSVRPWKWWDEGLHQYVPDLRVFYCPTATPHHFPLLQSVEVVTLRLTSGQEITGIPLDARAGKLLLAGTDGQTVKEVPLAELPPDEAGRWVEKARGNRSPLLPVSWDRREVGYGMNYRFSSAFADLKSYDFRRLLNPGRLVLVADAGTNTFLLRPTETMWKKDSAPRHEGCSNFLFADGHVESVNPESGDYSRPGAPGILAPGHWVPNFSQDKP